MAGTHIADLAYTVRIADGVTLVGVTPVGDILASIILFTLTVISLDITLTMVMGMAMAMGMDMVTATDTILTTTVTIATAEMRPIREADAAVYIQTTIVQQL